LCVGCPIVCFVCFARVSFVVSSMHVTKLMVNARPALPTSTRQAVRAAVHQLEQRFAQSTDSGITAELKSELNRAAGRVVRLAQFHPAEGRALKVRIGKLRQFTKIN